MNQKIGSALIILLLTVGKIAGQSIDFSSEIKTIESLILEDNLPQADTVLQISIERGKANQAYTELSKLVYWQGKIELGSNEDKSLYKAIALSKFISSQTKDALPNYRSNLDLSRLFNEQGDLKKALEVGEQAMFFASKTNSNEALVNCYYYLGEYSLRSGDIDPFFDNINKGHRILLENPEKLYKISARILNYKGAIKYFSSEPDSAYYFYQSALNKVDAMEDNTENRLYFPAAIKANMVLLKQSQNEFEEAMKLAEECIILNKSFLESSKKHPLRFRSQRNLSLAYRNLASLYEQIVDYDKLHRIAQIAYEHGKSTFKPKLLEYFSAVTLLAEAKNLIREFDAAIAVMAEAKKSLDAMDGEVPLLRANYHSILAAAHYGKEEYEKARTAYVLSNEFHLKAQKEAFSNDRLFTVMNLALCDAKLGNKQQAYSLLDKAYDFQVKQEQVSNRLLESLLMAKARTAEILGDYPTVLIATNNFLRMHQDLDINQASEVHKTKANTLSAKARYHLEQNKDVSFLAELDKELDSNITLLEKRKAFLESKENINALITENLELFEFAKKVNLELHKKTNETKYLEKLIGLHESSIYTRIRTRLNLNDNIAFFDLPDEIRNRERTVQDQLKANTSDIALFLKSSNEWNQLLDSIQTYYPEYYEMRYSTLYQPLAQLQEIIPVETTIVRYVFIDSSLYVYTTDSTNQGLTYLGTFNDASIPSMHLVGNDLEDFNRSNQRLYEMLWKPISNKINTKKVIIFPDRSLFNISFELLTPKKISSFKELIHKGLLGQYDISYNYSLFLLNKKEKMLEFEDDFVAFAPGFNNAMKNSYQMAISDSLYLDRTYLTLLPQPFSSEIAKRFSKRFSGSSFLNESASKQVFARNASEHKIIHIGTHAESNNVSPELSRLVFAKNVSDSTNINDNYLYTYEIYNQDLSSNLAILTACETGKPSYQPGEGMVSLAHAFNYAGSESILTSLWQIDEQSSTQILGYFYTYLEEGLPKDEALRLSKLDYLENAEGRTLHPQYWAGLILMGDTSPIELSRSLPLWVWIISGIVLLLLFTIFLNKRKAPN